MTYADLIFNWSGSLRGRVNDSETSAGKKVESDTDVVNKKTFIPDKSENEGIQRILSRTRGTGWPHPSLDGEVGSLRSHDEHTQTDILTSGLTSLPPSRRAPEERDSGFWEFVARYSGATVLDFHEVP